MVAKTSEHEYLQEESQRTVLRDKKHQNIIKRIDQQISSIEKVVAELLNSVCIDEMSAYQRLSIAVRFIGQYQRVLALRQSYDIEEPVNHEQEMMTRLMRQMRGEDVDED